MKKRLIAVLAIGTIAGSAYARDWVTYGSGVEATATLQNPTGLQAQVGVTGQTYSTHLAEGTTLVSFSLKNSSQTEWAENTTSLLVDGKYRLDDSNRTGVWQMLSDDGNSIKVTASVDGDTWNQQADVKNRIKYSKRLSAGGETPYLEIKSSGSGDNGMVPPGMYKFSMSAQGLVD